MFSSDFVIFGGYDDCIVTIPVGGSFMKLDLLKFSGMACLALVFGVSFSTGASAQINIQSDEGLVRIGPNGISIDADGEHVDIGGNGQGAQINARKNGKSATIRTSGNRTSINTVGGLEGLSNLSNLQNLNKLEKLNKLNNLNKVNTVSTVAIPANISVSENDLVINNNGVDKTIRCDGNSIVINSNHCDLTVTGNCKYLVINGNHNEVHVENVGSISLPGNHNTVTWKKGLGQSIKPTISIGGNWNNCDRLE